jgi:polar amino acid transport system substrate-binding protein
VKKPLKTLLIFFIFFLTLHANTLDKVSLRLQWKHQFEFAGFYVAKEYGYYKELGLDVELFEYDSNVDIVQEVINGEKEFGIWGSGVIEQAMKGKPLVLLANYFKRSPLAIIAQGDIILPSELAGKKLMIPKSDFNNVNYQQMFKLFGLNINDIEIVPSSFNIQDFINKKVDAYSSFLTNEPYILRKEGIRHNILDPNNYGIEMYDVNLFSSKEFVKNNPQLVEKFIKASNKGWEYALKHKEEVVDLILKKYNTQKKSKGHLLFEAQETIKMMLPNVYPIGSVDFKKVKKMGDFFIEKGMIKPFYEYQSILFQKIENIADLTKQEINYIEKNRVAPISVMQDFSPFSFEINGTYQGFVNDILSLLEEKTGLRFKRVTGQWIPNLQRFKAKETKIIADISYKKEREEFTLFTKPYYEIPTLIFVRDDFKDYKGIESFKGKKVGIQKNIFYAKEVGEIEGIDLVENESIEEMAKALSYGKIDIAIMNLLTMNHYIKKNALSNILAIDELNLKTVNREDLRFGVNIDQPLLYSIMQKGLEAISVQEWRNLTNKWIGLNAKELKQLKKETKIYNNDLLTKEEKEYLNKKNELKICVSPKWMPFEAIDENNKHIGMGLDIKEIISKKISKKITLVKTNSWEESLNSAKNKKCEILSLSKKTKERSEYLNFTNPIYNIPYVIVTKKDKFFIDSFEEIKNNKFAVIKSSAVEEDIQEFYPNIQIIQVKSIDEGLNLVQNNKVYGYIDSRSSIGYAIDKNEMYDLKIIGKLPIDYNLSYGIINTEEELFNIIQKAITSISKEEKDRIFRKWIAVEQQKVTDYSLVWKVIFVATFFILLIVYWNIKLYKAKQEIEKTNILLKKAQKEIEDKNIALEKLAITDKLTDVYNRTKLDEILLDEINRCKRFECSFGFCILDIDYFKSTNDSFGHLVGDKILISFAKLLKESIRETDYVGRWGGEEFVIIVPKTNKENLTAFAQKLRVKIENFDFEKVGKKTASFGITVTKENDTIETVIKRADDALYQAKKNGRNKVCFL